LLLENVRFYKEEEKNDEAFAKKLAAPFDMYVPSSASSSSPPPPPTSTPPSSPPFQHVV
jgi:hypothetical protein